MGTLVGEYTVHCDNPASMRKALDWHQRETKKRELGRTGQVGWKRKRTAKGARGALTIYHGPSHSTGVPWPGPGINLIRSRDS